MSDFSDRSNSNLDDSYGQRNRGKIDSNSSIDSLNPYYCRQWENDKTLVFESRFESGNLKRVV
jgi:hypothetical protein